MCNKYEAARQVIFDLRDLAMLTSNEKGAQRVAWSPVWDDANAWFKEKMEAEGAEIFVDSACNIWGKIAGESEDAILVGSHLDSVPDGGWLDGALGVAAGLGAARRYGCHGIKPKKTLYIVSWADEEGARFGRSCIGSSAASGTLNSKEIAQLLDNKGCSFSNVLRRYDRQVEDFSKAKKEFQSRKLKAYLELHIEQAPILENQHRAAACVYGITGCKRQYITFQGQASHAGAPISMRHDAFLAAAEAALAFREIGKQYDAYCTIGKVKVFPDVVTIFPGTCQISLDQRSIDADVLELISAKAHAAAEQAALNNGVKVQFEPVWSIKPVLFDANLKELCEQAVAAETGEMFSMYSGPLHDAAEMANILPSIMMFAMSCKGLSHCKEENTPDNELILAITAFLNMVDMVINR